MSGDDNPLRLWALQVKRKIRATEITPDILFEALVENDTADVYQYYHGYKVPKNPIERNNLDLRLHTLRYIAGSLVVN